MSNPTLFSVVVCLLFLVLNEQDTMITRVEAKTNVHIVYLGGRPHDDTKLITDSHHDMLASIVGSKEVASKLMVYSYKHGFSGFAAKITESQAQRLAGVWPESKVYNDEGLGPIPSHWKGVCQSGELFNSTHCNRKIIGARWFIDGFLAEYGQSLNTSGNKEFLSPRDANGHGTHTSSTAGGSFVGNISYKGLGMGTVRGGAPRARLAIYKVCWNVGGGQCSSADILKAFDKAIHDGVHVLSLSIGSSIPLFSDIDQRDGLATGSFHAVAKGIAVVCGAANDGPAAQTVQNTAPWILTVAASSMDRAFPTPIILGNNKTMLGQALFTGKEIGFTGLVYPEGTGLFSDFAGVCESLSINHSFGRRKGGSLLLFTGA
ncbi:hypothetical protein L1049_022969 [Liquidambar formosana]|uniref:Uncharacterized protein n=1 Tax=Liquidambar formosana TaxID=63359 RepID=A0AAP0REQ5_LIQFO